MKLERIFCAIIACALVFGFASCSDDDDPVTLALEKNEVSVEANKTSEVKILSGNGGYTITSGDDRIATAKEEASKIVVTGVASGETTITVKDQEGKTATIKVTVTKEVSIVGVWNVDKITVTAEGTDQDAIAEIKAILSKDDLKTITLKDGGRFEVLLVDAEEKETKAEGDYTYKDNKLSMEFDDEVWSSFTVEVTTLSATALKTFADHTEEYQTKYPDAGLTKVEQVVELSSLAD